MTTRDTRIGNALIEDLRSRLPLEDVAGVLLVSLERLIWLDANAFVWAVDQLIPADVTREIRQLTSLTVGKRLISKGFVPGKDFSADSTGKLLLNAKAKTAILGG